MNVNKIRNRQLVYVYRDFVKSETTTPTSAFIKLLIMGYKRQDRAGNGDSVEIQSVVC